MTGHALQATGPQHRVGRLIRDTLRATPALQQGAAKMNMVHVQPFLNAMDSRKADALEQHLSADVTLESPFVGEPFRGRQAVVGVLKTVLSAVDEFETTAVIPDEARAAVVLRIRAGETEVTGVDVMTIDADGLIDSMTVQWRPLAAVVAIQQRLAPLIGVPALELVEKSGGEAPLHPGRRR